ncbi:MAG: serine hydrolase domain-containing protein [Saprospiraceae bacterium]
MTKTSKISTIVLMLISAIGQFSQAQTDNTIRNIDSIVTTYMSDNKMVGVSIGIVKEGKIYLAKGYGVTEVNKLKPVDSLTNFLACSITKTLTATAIMKIVEDGKIDISKKLTYYIPDFTMKDERYKDITIEHLLTHTSGLYWDMELDHSPNDSSALRKLVYSLNDKILDFAPGTKFDATKTYSNAAFDILGYLVQNISGQQYEDYIKDNILQKANMGHSSIDYEKIPIDYRSAPHILKHNKAKVGGMITENKEHAPSANLNSCSLDLCNWMMHIMNIYNNKNAVEGVLQKSTLLNMWTARQVAPQNKNISMGLGWFMTDSKDLGRYYWHVGGNPGYSATLMLFPDKNFGITLMTNGMYAEQIVWNKMSYDIIELFNEGTEK